MNEQVIFSHVYLCFADKTLAIEDIRTFDVYEDGKQLIGYVHVNGRVSIFTLWKLCLVSPSCLGLVLTSLNGEI